MEPTTDLMSYIFSDTVWNRNPKDLAGLSQNINAGLRPEGEPLNLFLKGINGLQEKVRARMVYS